MTSKRVILLVDDEEDLLGVLAMAVDRRLPTYEVVAIPSAEEASKLVADLGRMGGELSLVLVDHVLGGESGLEFIDTLAKTHPDVPRLMYTGQAPAEVEQRVLESGGTVLWKPMRLRQVVDAIVRALDARA